MNLTDDALLALSTEPADDHGGLASAGDATPPSPVVRRRGRPPKRLAGRADASVRPLRGSFRKAYDLAMPDQRTVGHLRRIVAQREIPDTASVTVGADELTIEWSD